MPQAKVPHSQTGQLPGHSLTSVCLRGLLDVLVKLRLWIVALLKRLEVVRRDHVSPLRLDWVDDLARNLDVPHFLCFFRGISTQHADLTGNRYRGGLWCFMDDLSSAHIVQ